MIAIRLLPERKCNGCRRQVEWGCEAFSYEVVNAKGKTETKWHNAAKLPMDLLGVESWACPRQPIHQDPVGWNVALKFYGLYQKGFLPDRGAVVDQSNKAIEVFRVLDDINAAIDKEQADRIARKSGNGGGPPPKRRGL